MTQLKIIEEKKVHGGIQRRYQHLSQVLGCEMVFTLFLHENSEKETSLIWFLSGLTCDDQNFATKGGFQRQANQLNLAVVIPDTSPRGKDIPDADQFDLGQGAGFYLNATQEPWSQNFQMYDYITEELSDIVKELIPNFSGNESIIGHSMGGYGALQIGLKNPNRFKSISAFAPISNPTEVPWGKKAFSTYLGDNHEDWKEWDPVHLVSESETGHAPILITQGSADEFYPEQLLEDKFKKAVEQSNHALNYQFEKDYDHSYYTIQTFIDQHLAFHADHLDG
ncbi:S-formylglutathione hydrolase [Aerococcaceae bacterium DSM 111020]|nr:S-formylglutathione hydrolase [Aerococcaceae bacterium DSM 111020]